MSVLTPLYNMAAFLPECIESILGQSYENFEYIIVNNCSTDGSLEVVLEYAKRDPRIRIHNNDTFVDVIKNHNIAFSLISPAAKYCKVVCADDLILRDCIMRMIEFAEENPSVGIVGSYQVSGGHIRWQGFEYPRAVFSGREICRKILLGNDKTFGFGTPTSMLYRADLVRKSEAFYPNSSPHADTSACFKELRCTDFGFIYQVLSCERTHIGSQSSTSNDINRYSSAYLNDILQYGHFYLNRDEFDAKVEDTVKRYYEYLVVNLFKARGRQFWDYHKSRLEELGFPITPSKLLAALITKAFREFQSPRQALMKVFRHS